MVSDTWFIGLVGNLAFLCYAFFFILISLRCFPGFFIFQAWGRVWLFLYFEITSSSKPHHVYLMSPLSWASFPSLLV